MEERRRIHTCKIDPTSPKFMEAFVFVQRWLREKDDDGFRPSMGFRKFPPTAGMYEAILGDIAKTITIVGKAGWRPNPNGLNEDNSHFFGAWDDNGWLHGLATLTIDVMIPKGCPYKPETTISIESLCAGPGRFVDDEDTPPAGVGTSLLKHIVCWASGRPERQTIILDTTAQAERFYLRNGFERRRAWLGTSALGWMELHSTRWGQIMSGARYPHVMCDTAPIMTDCEWKALCTEVSPGILEIAMAAPLYPENPFLRRMVNLPVLYNREGAEKGG